MRTVETGRSREVAGLGSPKAQHLRECEVPILRFCGVFVMEGGKIRHLTSYLWEVK